MVELGNVFDNILLGLTTALQGANLFYCIVGVSLGAAVGAFVGAKQISPKVREALAKLSDEELKFLAQLASVVAAGVGGGVTAGAATGAATGGSMRLKQKLEEIKSRRGSK